MMERHFAFWPHRRPHSLTLPATSLHYNLTVSAARYPDKPALIYYGREITYRALADEVARLAGYLQQQCGVVKGDRVMLYLQNSPQFVIGYYAVLMAGGVVVPVNPMNRTAELAHYADDSGAHVSIAGQELFGHIAPLAEQGTVEHVVVAAYADYLPEEEQRERIPEIVGAPRAAVQGAGVVAWSEALAANEAFQPIDAGPDDLAVLPYTSGTTGSPKGCMHTHRSVMATAVGAASWQAPLADTVHLMTLPLFHVTGMTHSMNEPIYTGATMVVMTRWDRDLAAELIQRHRVTHWINIATMAIDFLANPRAGEFDLSSLEVIGGGGAAMPAAVAERLHKLTGLTYAEGYGLSETMSQTHMNPPDRAKAQCLGIPSFDVDSRILDVETGRQLGPDEVGEIVSRGPQIFQGYWRRPEATEAAFIELDGERLFRTGDLGYYDEEGYFFLVDRLKRMINAAGYKVWPADVEAILYRHPDILEACVIASPDERRGETVKAMVVLHEGGTLDEAALIAWAREQMSAYKVPRRVEFVAELPKTATGKLQWRTLQEQEWAAHRARGD